VNGLDLDFGSGGRFSGMNEGEMALERQVNYNGYGGQKSKEKEGT
jgi:hypothetical protein